MSVQYNGSHSVIFWTRGNNGMDSIENHRNTWTDFHLIPTCRLDVAFPEPKYTIVSIPGSNKRIDITDYLPGKLRFGEITGEWEFYIDNSQWTDWEEAYTTLTEYFHGNRFYIQLTDDSTKVYTGLIVISSYSPEKDYSKIKLKYDLDSGFYDFSDPLRPKVPNSRTSFIPSLYLWVRFFGRNNELLYSDSVMMGDTPSYSGTPPEDDYYKFKKWNPPLGPIYTDTDYHAIYKDLHSYKDDSGSEEVKPKPIEELPDEIVVVTQLIKTNYNDGEAIDLTGAVIKAYKENAIWTSQKYPNGIIPNNALILRERYADAEKASGLTYSSLENPVYGGVTYEGTINATTLEGNNYVYVSDNGKEGVSRDIYAVMPYPNTFYTWVDGRVIIATSDYNAISYGGTNYPGFWVLRRASGAREIATSVMHDGKTAYVYAFNAGDYNKSETVPDSDITGPSNLIIGWMMVYGSETGVDPESGEIIYNTGHYKEQTIPIEWNRPIDGRTLSTEIIVRVSEPPESPETSETPETTL